MSTRLLLAGYFGCGNLGDDAILVGLTEGLAGQDVELEMLSGEPELSFRTYGIRAVPRKDFKAIVEALDRCDALVFPGGSVFQDVTSVRSCAYYADLVRRAKKANKKVFFLSQGVGPLGSFMGKRAARFAFDSAEAIVVRDPGSAQVLRELGVKTPVRQGADLSFLMAPRKQGEDGDFQVGGMKTVGIAPRPWGKNQKNLNQLFGDLSQRLFKAGFMPVLIEMDKHEDGPMIYEIGKLQGGKVPDIRRMDTPMLIQQRISRMASVIAMRLHAGILATNVGVPPFMISYDPKVTAFAKLLGLHSAPPIEGMTSDRLFEGFMAFLKDRERNQQIVLKKRDEMVQMASVNIQALEPILKSPARR